MNYGTTKTVRQSKSKIIKGLVHNQNQHNWLSHCILNTRNPMMEPEAEVDTFPQRLMSLLEDEEGQLGIRWLPDGQAFEIYDSEMFEQILKARFNSIQLNSFVFRLKSKCCCCRPF
jgi:hypothetical protein